MRGRKPKPTALKIAEGNPGKRPLNANEPKPEPVTPACPKWLAPRSRSEWKRIVPELERLGLLTRIDRAALACYCEAWADLQAAAKLLADEGLTVLTQNGYQVAHPGVAMKKQAMASIRAFASEFGLTPASRSRVTATKAGEVDELAEFNDTAGPRLAQ